METRFRDVRAFSLRLCEPLQPSDLEAQSMPDCSPLKWHLAHTTWFFETFVLRPYEAKFQPHHERFEYLFNSYYNAVGPRHPRSERGLLTRPTLDEVLAYRRALDERVEALLASTDAQNGTQHDSAREIVELVTLGCHHEQQHQELMLTDLKHLFSRNALRPTYSANRGSSAAVGGGEPGARRLHMERVDGGLYEVGALDDGFAFDNERPRHRVYVESFEISDRLVTNAEYEEFVRGGGYLRPELWLDAGFAWARSNGLETPLYWQGQPGEFREFTLNGERALEPDEPVCHVSLYEADAFARWAGARLPREQEWEVACRNLPVVGTFAESARFHPAKAPGESGLRQCFGDVWEWTSSAYSPYPGFTAAAGAVGEYNGKFMCNQFVLRGGSVATPAGHIRGTYRNFFHAPDRWQFTGIRLARDVRSG